MKLSLNWLKSYVDLKLSTDDLTHRLTMAGLEVEAAHSIGGDTVLELEITPNRPDCLSVWGLSREIAAITGKTLRLPRIKAHKATKNKIPITIEDKKDCARYIATLIEGVTIAASPAETSKRLSAIGLKVINNAVDVTNFVLMETGQPLHAFDYDKIDGGKIIVRRAKSGERIITLDGVERKLDPSILVIADARKPVAIAGVMGGKSTEITADTKNILLESASFDAGLVRRASRQLTLKSDSSYRFERGVDFEGVLTAANRATDLICSLTNGNVVGRTDCFKTIMAPRKPLVISTTDIEGLLGSSVLPAKIKTFLTSLGFALRPSGKNTFRVTPPTWRGDIKANVDIVEEVARMVGYDRLSEGLPVIKAVNIRVDARPRKVKEGLAQALVSQGFCETVTYSLIGPEMLKRSGLNVGSGAPLRNFLSRDHSILRPSMLPSILAVVQTNVNRGQKDLRLFEIGKVYAPLGERTALGVIMTGRRSQDWCSNSRDVLNLFDLKGAIEQALSRLGITGEWQAPTYPADAAADLWIDGKNVGHAGRVGADILSRWDIKAQNMYFAQIDLEAVFTMPAPELKYRPVAVFPAITRDVSLAVTSDVPYSRIENICLSAGSLLKGVHLIEEYTGDKIGTDKRALVFSMTYQSDERTLREDEVNALHQNVLKTLCDQTGAVLR